MGERPKISVAIITLNEEDIEDCLRSVLWADSKATGEWILSLDADERVSEELKDEILRVINDPDACDGYLVARRNYWLGKWIRHGGWYPDYTLKVWPGPI